jgi:type II secretory pathway pseudopilin PulG
MALAVGGFDFVKQKQANDQAKIQISLLSNAIEEYKLDNGSYPPTGSSNSIYRLLYWDGADQDPPGKIYVSQLDPVNNKQGWTDGENDTANIVDPWGAEYLYRDGSDPAARNPDFDLISKGKDGQENTADDIRN